MILFCVLTVVYSLNSKPCVVTILGRSSDQVFSFIAWIAGGTFYYYWMHNFSWDRLLSLTACWKNGCVLSSFKRDMYTHAINRILETPWSPVLFFTLSLSLSLLGNHVTIYKLLQRPLIINVLCHFQFLSSGLCLFIFFLQAVAMLLSCLYVCTVECSYPLFVF